MKNNLVKLTLAITFILTLSCSKEELQTKAEITKSTNNSTVINTKSMIKTRSGGSTFYINHENCIECGACIENSSDIDLLKADENGKPVWIKTGKTTAVFMSNSLIFAIIESLNETCPVASEDEPVFEEIG
ncbi:MAG: hypothetical protein A2X19_09005 [Bacteroidetes bacterium GWE2_39_28]|nr:hypothetical protein [Bacteroidales bacterium]OFX76457.1 MAG: hypothetical protein A2X19_09005 [Bacteroidetes bacterium GWE2_39_28]OFY12154.1 MAG: hypothetical protein A2X16_06290 [Bacteroidetes bacterium GWF2_39_10]OFZ08114.1 MAG: hypothetical protein A2322_07855 [Bacteroidetes bacterium RIFOXYB2_FULL_39_7]OFZ10354.1 MAG: hypothetical protein A2465_02825 [Bacteroidetes bacterium RIFOXYC2_FULL_39_11]HCT94181.1 hypothetical protein [Rikenellaceae bacterium]